VSEGLGEAFPNTMQLALMGFALTIIFGTLLGLAAAGKWGGWLAVIILPFWIAGLASAECHEERAISRFFRGERPRR
jgi:ABC-type dipeptide/oligopeptide/nickel transport system permease component